MTPSPFIATNLPWRIKKALIGRADEVRDAIKKAPPATSLPPLDESGLAIYGLSVPVSLFEEFEEGRGDLTRGEALRRIIVHQFGGQT